MRADAHIPEADEALRALFDRFKEDPASQAAEALADALLARGHASEAQIIAEHGLQFDPMNPNGRVLRAAALMALGRPRVAYVELVRALAIQPGHPRGLRLLGRVYVDAGLPERAAALLSQRHLGAPSAARAPSTVDASSLTRAPTPPPPPPAPPSLPPALSASLSGRAGLPTVSTGMSPAPGQPSREISDLFASLTKDLGLGGGEAREPSRVEVTQVMRIRRNVADDHDELSSIDGPIVDATQPGKLQWDEAQPPPNDFLFDVITTPRLPGLTPDEPLFNDVAPLTRPAGESSDTDTLDDGRTPLLEMSALDEAQRAEQRKIEAASGERPPVLGTEPSGLPYLKRFERAREPAPSLPPAAETVDLPLRGPRLQVVERTRGPRATALAVVGAAVLLGWLAGLGWLARDTLSVWMSARGPAVPSAEHAERSRP